MNTKQELILDYQKSLLNVFEGNEIKLLDKLMTTEKEIFHI